MPRFARCRFATMCCPSDEKTWVIPTVGILPPLRGSNVNIVFTVGFAAPKALASPTAKFHSPLRGCSRALTGAVVRAAVLPPAALTMFACRRLRLYRAPRERSDGGTLPPPRHALRASAVLRVDVTTASPPLTACETAVRRRTLQRRNCNDGVPVVAPILPHP